jgi:hypothetical protein
VRISSLHLWSFLLMVLSLSTLALHGAAAGAKQPKAKKHDAVIEGTVWGPDDRPIYGVKVKIRRAQDKKAKWELYSDHNGEFAQRFPARQADYVFTVDLKDSKPSDGKPLRLVQEVTVHIDYDERINISLHLTH